MRGVTTMENRKELTKLVSSFVIGDGALSSLKQYGKGKGNYEIGREKNSKYYLKQLATHKDYIEWQADILENLTKIRISCIEEFVDSRGYTNHCKYELSTMCHPFYTTMRKNFYLNNEKIIHPHYLKLWDEKSLAILYMDDGWLEKKLNKDNTIYYRIGIATHNYSYGDNMLLKQFIKEKFSIEFDINRHKQKSGEYKWYLRNSKENSLRFIDLVEPYIFNSFSYKVDKSISTQLTPTTEGEDIV